MSFKRKFYLGFVGAMASLGVFADNPLIPNVGMADPHIRIFNKRAYMYATRDADPNAKDFVMPDWKIWSSDDLVNWTLERTIKPTETYIGESNGCWATDAETKSGKYYFYFSNKNIDTGVMVGESPTGPFWDALGKPLLPENLTPIKEYDPTILIDDDAKDTPYIAFGHYRSTDPSYYYCIARLNDDMISLAEKPKEIKIIGDTNVLGGNDKPTLHKRNGIYYLSAGSHYATSTNIYGPYTKIGNSGNGEYGLTNPAHGNYFDWNNQSFHVWCHFFLGKEVARYRESYLTYLHYKENGEMVDDVAFLDAHFSTGVGQYDANWKKIEAEWYMAATKAQKKECPNGGFEISRIGNGGSLYFPNVKNLDQANSATFCVSSNSGGTIEIREVDANGKLLGRCEIPTTGGWTSYKNISCKLENAKEIKNIYLKFNGKGEDLFHLDWFRFDTKN